jgi:outer membrane biogenesis lipoprotein LolB
MLKNGRSRERSMSMKTHFGRIALTICVLLIACSSAVAKDTRVKGYTKKDGTYVAPHSRTTPDKSKQNNYSTKGNTNPHTGKKGTVAPTK